MAGVNRRAIFLDTSVLLAGLIELGKAEEPAQTLMDALAAGRIGDGHTAWHCCLEFYSVATRLPEEFRLEPVDAARLLESEVIGRLGVHRLPADARASMIAAAARDRVVGGRVYDAHIAEVARSVPVDTVVTDNRRDFVGLLRHGVRMLDAGEAVEELS